MDECPGLLWFQPFQRMSSVKAWHDSRVWLKAFVLRYTCMNGKWALVNHNFPTWPLEFSLFFERAFRKIHEHHLKMVDIHWLWLWLWYPLYQKGYWFVGKYLDMNGTCEGCLIQNFDNWKKIKKMRCCSLITEGWLPSWYPTILWNQHHGNWINAANVSEYGICSFFTVENMSCQEMFQWYVLQLYVCCPKHQLISHENIECLLVALKATLVHLLVGVDMNFRHNQMGSCNSFICFS